eukprot:7210327-Lingulodinium_polyedra.AAC.1
MRNNRAWESLGAVASAPSAGAASGSLLAATVATDALASGAAFGSGVVDNLFRPGGETNCAIT